MILQENAGSFGIHHSFTTNQVYDEREKRGSMSYTLLITEDDDALREIMEDYFTARQYRVLSAPDGETAAAYAETENMDAILLDINLPDISGFEVCERIRKLRDTPILFITARGSEADKLNGYSLGADDYITKPFRLTVLQAKLEAMLKRIGNHAGVRTLGRFKVYDGDHTIEIDGERISLPLKEYDLFVFLAENPGRLYTREQLLIRFWGYDYEGTDRVVDDHIRKLRKALGKYRDCIKTVHRAGYSFGGVQ